MAGADDDSAAWAAQFAELLAGQAAAALELLNLMLAELPGGQHGEDAAWLRSAERLEALWRQFLEEHSEAFVAAWPDIVRELNSLLPLLGRMQPLFAMLAQLLPLLAGPQVLGRAIDGGGEGLVKGLEQLLADRCLGQSTSADPAGDPSGPDRTLP